jgi:enoyl-CoA hydratase
MVCEIRNGNDFFEGVRAQLLDKDRNPLWSPARLEDVTDADVARHFEEPESGDLTFE